MNFVFNPSIQLGVDGGWGRCTMLEPVPAVHPQRAEIKKSNGSLHTGTASRCSLTSQGLIPKYIFYHDQEKLPTFGDSRSVCLVHRALQCCGPLLVARANRRHPTPCGEQGMKFPGCFGAPDTCHQLRWSFCRLPLEAMHNRTPGEGTLPFQPMSTSASQTRKRLLAWPSIWSRGEAPQSTAVFPTCTPKICPQPPPKCDKSASIPTFCTASRSVRACRA